MSYTRNYLHIVFGTKYRIRAISPDKKERLYKYMAKTIHNKKCELININGIENHIHLLINLHPSVSLADLVKSIKVASSRLITETHYLPLFEGWATEYYACSVSPSHLKFINEYIDCQEVHHKEKGYEDEMNRFVKKMGMDLYRDEE